MRGAFMRGAFMRGAFMRSAFSRVSSWMVMTVVETGFSDPSNVAVPERVEA